MQKRVLGNHAVGRHEIGAIGLGCMTMDQEGPVDRRQLLQTVTAAVEAGMTLIDTADAYGPGERGAAAQGENEKLVAGLLDEAGLREHVVLATKAGHVRLDPTGGWDLDGSADYLRGAVDASLQRLGTDRIQLWQHHRPDPKVDYAETLGALREVHDAGKVQMVGLSNADPEQIRQAREILGDALVSVQNQLSPKFRSSLPEVELCEELGLIFLAWSPLGGLNDAKELAARHPAFAEVADARGISPQQVALAWEIAQSRAVVPIPGAKRPQSVLDSAAAADIHLTPDELARLDAVPAGTGADSA